jgi:predicted transcriptional regulator
VTKLSLDELRKKLYFLSDLEINLVYDYWHKDKHTTADDIADKYGYNKMKIYRTIKKIKNNNV